MWTLYGKTQSKFNLPHSKIFLSLSPVGCFLLSLFPIERHLQFSLQILIAESMPTSHFTIDIMKVPKLSTLHVHDVVGNSVVCYQHHEGA